VFQTRLLPLVLGRKAAGRGSADGAVLTFHGKIPSPVYFVAGEGRKCGNQMFRDAFNEVQDTGSNRDFGTTKAAKMYFSMSNPGPNAFAGNDVGAPKFSK